MDGLVGFLRDVPDRFRAWDPHQAPFFREKIFQSTRNQARGMLTAVTTQHYIGVKIPVAYWPGSADLGIINDFVAADLLYQGRGLGAISPLRIFFDIKQNGSELGYCSRKIHFYFNIIEFGEF